MYHLEISARLQLEFFHLFLAKVDSIWLVPCIIANYAFASCLLLMERALSAQISLNIWNSLCFLNHLEKGGYFDC